MKRIFCMASVVPLVSSECNESPLKSLWNCSLPYYQSGDPIKVHSKILCHMPFKIHCTNIRTHHVTNSLKSIEFMHSECVEDSSLNISYVSFMVSYVSFKFNFKFKLLPSAVSWLCSLIGRRAFNWHYVLWIQNGNINKWTVSIIHGNKHFLSS